MSTEYAIVDLFAGPGGLAEGFSSVRAGEGWRPFRIALSVEKDSSAHATLLLRSFLRQFVEPPSEYFQFLNKGDHEPDWSILYPREWEAANEEALQLELGIESTKDRLNPILDDIRERYQGNVILIGGPPCQAYSLAGRARNKGIAGYVAEEDHRHYLYQEYIGILERLQPAAFVMENVKGMLSAAVGGGKVFDRVLDDLEAPGEGREGYDLVALTPRSNRMLDLGDGHFPITDFIIRAEDFGVPQARHRVIVVGLRKDVAARHDPGSLRSGLLRDTGSRATVQDVLGGMPRLRSGLSRSKDSEAAWRTEVMDAMATVASLRLTLPGNQAEVMRERAMNYALNLARSEAVMSRTGERPVGIGPDCPEKLRDWILNPLLEILPNNETRSHMTADLARYFYSANFGEVTGTSPRARDFPVKLAPEHRSWSTGGFDDRFRVQLWDQPSTTVTSHISKDGHAFIHPDPMQCRSLTVREAARLQTFPDDYLFRGNRTQQYIQVGNAVPPYLARLIAESLFKLLEGEPIKAPIVLDALPDQVET